MWTTFQIYAFLQFSPWCWFVFATKQYIERDSASILTINSAEGRGALDLYAAVRQFLDTPTLITLGAALVISTTAFIIMLLYVRAVDPKSKPDKAIPQPGPVAEGLEIQTEKPGRPRTLPPLRSPTFQHAKTAFRRAACFYTLGGSVAAATCLNGEGTSRVWPVKAIRAGVRISLTPWMCARPVGAGALLTAPLAAVLIQQLGVLQTLAILGIAYLTQFPKLKGQIRGKPHLHFWAVQFNFGEVEIWQYNGLSVSMLRCFRSTVFQNARVATSEFRLNYGGGRGLAHAQPAGGLDAGGLATLRQKAGSMDNTGSLLSKRLFPPGSGMPSGPFSSLTSPPVSASSLKLRRWPKKSAGCPLWWPQGWWGSFQSPTAWAGYCAWRRR